MLASRTAVRPAHGGFQAAPCRLDGGPEVSLGATKPVHEALLGHRPVVRHQACGEKLIAMAKATNQGRTQRARAPAAQCLTVHKKIFPLGSACTSKACGNRQSTGRDNLPRPAWCVLASTARPPSSPPLRMMPNQAPHAVELYLPWPAEAPSHCGQEPPAGIGLPWQHAPNAQGGVRHTASRLA